MSDTELNDFASLMVDEMIASLRNKLAKGVSLTLEEQRAVLDQLIKERKRLNAAAPLQARKEG